MEVVVESALNTMCWIKSQAVQNAKESPNSAVLPKLKTKSAKLYVIFMFCVCT